MEFADGSGVFVDSKGRWSAFEGDCSRENLAKMRGQARGTFRGAILSGPVIAAAITVVQGGPATVANLVGRTGNVLPPSLCNSSFLRPTLPAQLLRYPSQRMAVAGACHVSATLGACLAVRGGVLCAEPEEETCVARHQNGVSGLRPVRHALTTVTRPSCR